MTPSVMDQFVALLAAEEDPAKREALIKRARMTAMNEAKPEAFEPPIRCLGEYLDTPIEIPPALVAPTIVVRGEITATLGRAGYGKAQPYTAKILTPTGWTTMKDIQVGDYVVCPVTGELEKVEGKYPQGSRPVRKVTFSDGACTEADAQHLWRVKDRHGIEKTVPTDSLRSSWSVVTPTTFDFRDDLERPLDPWIVGFLLGDGGLCSGGIRFSTADPEIVERVEKLLPTSTIKHVAAYDYAISFGLALDHIRQLDMVHGSHAKRVPPAYLHGTFESRLETLRGLMDSDGHCSGEFCSMSKGLVEDVIYLARSLSGTAKMHRQRPNGAWRTVVSIAVCPFWLGRKASNWKLRLDGRIDKRYVRTVEDAGETETCCIKVSGEHELYVTDDFIVTHNTTYNLNRLIRWAAGTPLFDTLTDSDGAAHLRPEKPLRILIIENEGSAGMFHQKVGIMLRALDEADRALARENILIWGDGGYSGLKLDDPAMLHNVRVGCEKYEPDILFVEPFRSLWKGEENSSTDMANMVDSLVALATDYGCGVLLSHHERKSGAGEDGELMSAGRGSTVLEGVVALMENFQKVKGGDFRELTWSKARYLPPPPPTRLQYDESTLWYRHVAMDEIEGGILRRLQEAEAHMTVKQLASELEETESKLRPILNRLVKEDRLKKTQNVSDGMGSTGAGYRLPSLDSENGGLAL